MELQLVMILLKFLDICPILQGDVPHILIVERDDQSDEVEKPIKTTWIDFQFSTKEELWERKSSKAQVIPFCNALRVASQNDTLTAVCESNIKDALYLFTVPFDEKIRVEPIRINVSRASALNIKIPPSGEWSTPYLSTRQNLFNAHLFPLNNHQSIIIANAADASASIFNVDSTVQDLSRIERCIEPCIINVAEHTMVFSRRCPKGWPVFYNLPDTRNVPELLPLVAYILNKDYSTAETLQLSKGWYTGASFAFDVCSTAGDAIVLATVSGLLNKPHLQILRSLDNGKTWKELTVIALKEVPVKVRVIATGSRILVACTFKKHDGYHVMAAEFDR